MTTPPKPASNQGTVRPVSAILDSSDCRYSGPWTYLPQYPTNYFLREQRPFMNTCSSTPRRLAGYLMSMAFCGLSPIAMAETVYKWADERGIVHYSNHRFPGKTVEQIEILPGPCQEDVEKAKQLAERDKREAGSLQIAREHPTRASPGSALGPLPPNAISEFVRTLVDRSINMVTYQASSKSNFFQRNTTGAAFISSIPLRMRALSSGMEVTRIWRRKVRAIFEKAHSIRLSQEPCLGV